ncbi:MAG: ABC transporter substrate-binding protein [Acidimicrobiales bacterium]
MKVTRRFLGVMFALAMVAAACGGDDDDGAGDTTTTGGDGAAADEVTTDFGADEDTIRVGILADLSGPFATLVNDIVLAQEVYWDRVNDAGGIAGREIEVVTVDTRYDIPTHQQQYQSMRAEDENGVLIISQSTGSPHTASIAADLVADNLIAIPLSWYSGWADPDFGQNVFEAYTNYCFEGINGVQFIADEGGETVAIATFPGEYGQDSATGAKLAAEELGLEVVYDGEGLVIPPSATNPNPDNSGVVSSIVDASPDWVWATVNPATLATMMGQADASGFEGKWTGASPSYSDVLLTSDVAELIDSSFWQSAYTVALGTDVPGMQDMIDAISAAEPDARASDAYVYGWTEAQITEAILRAAAESGDLTREGVVRAAFEVEEVDFGGLAPTQGWSGEPNDYLVRESYIFKPRVSLRTPGPIGSGTTGSELVEGPFASPISEDYDFQGPCFEP